MQSVSGFVLLFLVSWPPKPSAESRVSRTSSSAGHRGLCGVYPEHTIASYQGAIKAGADFIECDGEMVEHAGT